MGYFYGGDQADYYAGTDQNDTAFGNGGDDVLSGGSGDDYIDGGTGNDTLFGGAGRDHLLGGAGDDILYPGRDGADTVEGGAGFDTLVLEPHSGGYTELVLSLPTPGAFSLLDDGGADFTAVSGIERFVLVGAAEAYGSDQADWITLVGTTRSPASFDFNQLLGNGGDDRLEGDPASTAYVLFEGGDGDDVISSGGGADALLGGTGADTFRYDDLRESTKGDHTDFIADFESREDVLDLTTISGGRVLVERLEANDPAATDAGESYVSFAPDASGTLQGGILVSGLIQIADIHTDTPTVFALHGSSSYDLLAGGAGGDEIYGGAGDDLIVGGGGADTLRGDAGADVFRYNDLSDSTLQAFDIILDFEHGVDKIDLTPVAGGVVNIVQDDAGTSLVFYAPQPDGAGGFTAGGAIVVHGEVEDADVVAAPGTAFYDTHVSDAFPSAVHDLLG